MSLTAEQLKLRKHTIGASEIAAIAGLNPWMSAHDVWCVKRGLAEELGDVTTRMGQRVEAAVLEEYCLDQRASVAHFGTIIHPKNAWMSATPDAAVFGVRRLLEIKCTGWRIAHHWGTDVDAIPAYYRPQVEWQMECCDADECHVAAWIGGADFRIYTIKRDRELAEMLTEIGRQFWFDHVLTGEPPTVDSTEGARRMLDRLYPRNRTPLKEATPEIEAIAKSLRDARAAVKQAEGRASEFENKMVAAIGDAEGIAAKDWRVTYRADKAGRRRFLFKDQSAA